MSFPGFTPSRSSTGIPGVGIADITIRGRKYKHYTAHCGQRTRTFNIVTLGQRDALRRALRARSNYEIKIQEAK